MCLPFDILQIEDNSSLSSMIVHHEIAIYYLSNHVNPDPKEFV